MTFVIVRVGVYDQGVVGVCEDLSEAKRIAEKYSGQEIDNYHDFQIRRSSGDEFDVGVGRFGAQGFRHQTKVWEWNDSTDTSEIRRES